MRIATLLLIGSSLLYPAELRAQDASDLLRAIADGVDKANGKKKPSKKDEKSKKSKSNKGEKDTPADAPETEDPPKNSDKPTDVDSEKTAASGKTREKPSDTPQTGGIQALLKAKQKDKLPPGHKKRTEVVVQKGDIKHLAGSTALDETIVGTCFDDQLNVIDARLPGTQKGRDADEQNTNVVLINSDEKKRLNLSVLNLFNIGTSEQNQMNFLWISHQTTLKKWRIESPTAVNSAPPEAAYCAVEATEGRSVDVLYKSTSALSEVELSGIAPQGKGSFAEIGAKYNMEYTLKVRGYKTRDDVALPNYQSLSDVMAAITPGAPFVSDVTLVATRDQVREYVEATTTRQNTFKLFDGYTQPFTIDKTGTVTIDVTSTAGVVLSFRDYKECKRTPESTRHVVTCNVTQPITMDITNPAILGLGSDAQVKVSVTSVSRK